MIFKYKSGDNDLQYNAVVRIPILPQTSTINIPRKISPPPNKQHLRFHTQPLPIRLRVNAALPMAPNSNNRLPHQNPSPEITQRNLQNIRLKRYHQLGITSSVCQNSRPLCCHHPCHHGRLSYLEVTLRVGSFLSEYQVPHPSN